MLSIITNGGNKIKNQEDFSFYSHFVGFIAAIVGTVLLLYVSRETVSKSILSIIYGFSVIFLFLASSLYHAFKRKENEVNIFRKLDHFAIFVMIAGTYTPICFIYLTGNLRWAIIIVQWSLVLAGFFFKFFYLKVPRYLYTIIYLIMGWVGIVTIKEFIMVMSKSSIIFLFAGGISYTIGALFYIMKKPIKRLGFGFHEIFHLFILLGAFLHYLLIYTAIAG